MKTLARIREIINESSNSFRIPRADLNIPRYQMPQIEQRHYSEFLDLMRLRGASVSHIKIQADKLKCIQSEINMEKVKKWAKHLPAGAKNKPCIVSSDFCVADGNHTWLAQLYKDPKCFIPCIQIGMDITQLLNTSKLFDKTFNKTIKEEFLMLFDMPNSLVDKVVSILNEQKKKESENSDSKSKEKGEKKDGKKPPFGKKKEKDEDDPSSNELSGKKEKITLNPEIKPNDTTKKPFNFNTKTK